VKNSYVSQI